MSMNYHYYVGVFVKLDYRVNISEIFDEEFENSFVDGRGELAFSERDNVTYLIPNKHFGVERDCCYDKYGDNLKVQSFSCEQIIAEKNLFLKGFAQELEFLKDCGEFTIEWGVVPSCG